MCKSVKMSLLEKQGMKLQFVLSFCVVYNLKQLKFFFCFVFHIVKTIDACFFFK